MLEIKSAMCKPNPTHYTMALGPALFFTFKTKHLLGCWTCGHMYSGAGCLLLVSICDTLVSVSKGREGQQGYHHQGEVRPLDRLQHLLQKAS